MANHIFRIQMEIYINNLDNSFINISNLHDNTILQEEQMGRFATITIYNMEYFCNIFDNRSIYFK